MLSVGRPWEGFSTEINRRVDVATEEADRGRKPRDYLGGSRLGDECARKLSYEFHKIPRDPGRGFDGRLLRIFERGHDAETRVVSQLQRAGWQVLRGDVDDPRTSWKTAGGKLAGHADGVVLGGPTVEGLSYPCLLEIKCLNNSNWGSAHREGVRLSHPLYYVQVQTYMAYLNLATAWFLVENADTCELHAEIVPLDLRAAQEASDRGVRIIRTRDPEEMPRAYHTRMARICKECFYQDRCWSSPAPAMPVPPPAVGVPEWIRRINERGKQ